jgi:hypothetical protein
MARCSAEEAVKRCHYFIKKERQKWIKMSKGFFGEGERKDAAAPHPSK